MAHACQWRARRRQRRVGLLLLEAEAEAEAARIDSGLEEGIGLAAAP